LQEFERQKIADAMEPKKFQDGDMIIEQVRCPYSTWLFYSVYSRFKALINVNFSG